jgi:hypothetical protein
VSKGYVILVIVGEAVTYRPLVVGSLWFYKQNHELITVFTHFLVPFGVWLLNKKATTTISISNQSHSITNNTGKKSIHIWQRGNVRVLLTTNSFIKYDNGDGKPACKTRFSSLFRLPTPREQYQKGESTSVQCVVWGVFCFLYHYIIGLVTHECFSWLSPPIVVDSHSSE